MIGLRESSRAASLALDEPEWRFLLELQWWHGARFVQRFHAWDVEGRGRPVWDQAWPLFELQQAYKRLRAARYQLSTSPDGAA